MKFPTRYLLLFGERAVVGVLVAASLFATVAANAQMRDSDRGDDRGGGMRGVGTGIGVGIGVGIIQGIINNPQNGQGQNSDDRKSAKKPDKKTTAKTPAKDQPPRPPAAPPPATTDQPPATTDKPPTPTDAGPPPTTTSGGTPPDNPGGTVPPPPQGPHDADVPRGYGRNAPDTCPQRGMGCAALIIDFNTHTAGDMTPFVDHFADGGACQIEFVSTDFLSGDALAKANAALNKNNKPNDPWKNVNNLEWDRVNAAIARHRARVARGAEIAIEIIRGEGYPAEIRTCGSVGPSDGASLDRQKFVDGNYEAANKHVCGWVMADFSCHSGYTPQAFDEINNGALQYPSAPDASGHLDGEMHACTGRQANDCASHAGYDFDIAMGQSTAKRSACALFTPALRKSLIGQLVHKSGTITFDQDWRHVGFGSYYSDQGYRTCNPVVRDGYTSETGPPPSGAPVTGVAPVTAGSTTTK